MRAPTARCLADVNEGVIMYGRAWRVRAWEVFIGGLYCGNVDLFAVEIRTLERRPRTPAAPKVCGNDRYTACA